MSGNRLQNLSIKSKLILVITLVATLVSFAEIVLYFYQDSSTFRESRQTRAQVVAEIIGVNLTPSLKFHDRADAMEILRSLKAESSVRAAYLFTDEGGLLAEYLNEGEMLAVPLVSPGDPAESFGEDSYSLTHPIVLGEKTIGTLHVVYDLVAFRERARGRLKLGIIAGIVSAIFAALLAFRLQRLFVDPIRALGDTVDHVTQTGDFSIRAPIAAHDEFGKVIAGFNHMLSEIGRRDAQLAQQMKLLGETNKELDLRVAERTAELLSTNKELESFSYSVSHDLRAPLRSIQGFSQIMLDEYGPKVDEEGRRLLSIISSDVLKMGQLVDDLLAFCRMGRQQMASSVVDMNGMTRQVFEQLQSARPQQNIEFTLGDLPPVSGDNAMLRQVMFNLLSNGLKFSSGREQSVIKVSSRADGPRNVFTVEDNGVGFDMRYKSKLFGVFQRLHSEQEFEGTGVGLAIVERIIQRHGGTIDADSVLGQGTKFYFSLPKVPDDQIH